MIIKKTPIKTSSQNQNSNSKNIKLTALAVPLVIENLLFMLLGFIDVFALSQVDGTASAAIGTANQLVNFCNILFTVISGASAVAVSQCLGANQRKRASVITALSLAFNLVLGLVISIIMLLFKNPLISLIGAEGEAFNYATDYLSIVGMFLFGQAVMNSASSILRSYGYTKISMYITVIMNIINTTLDLLFVFYFKLNVKEVAKGVAIATSLSRMVGLTIIIIVLFTKIEKLSVFKMLKPLPINEFISLMKIGIPSAFESLNYNISQIVVTSIVLNCLDNYAYVTKNYVTSITMFFYIFSLSIGQAGQIAVGHKVGNKEFDSAYNTGKRAFIVGFLLSMFMSLLGIVFRENLMSIFDKDKNIIALGSTLIILNIFLEMGRTVNLIIINCLKGSGDVVFPTVAAIFSMWLLSTLLGYILAVPLGFGIKGLWIAFACDECFRGILMLFRWYGGKWRTKRIV